MSNEETQTVIDGDETDGAMDPLGGGTDDSDSSEHRSTAIDEVDDRSAEVPAPRRDGGAESDDTDADTGDDVDAEDVEGGDAESVDPEDRDIASVGIDSADPEGGDAGNGDAESGDTGNGDTEDDNPLEVEAEVAADYLEELLDIADLDGDIDTYIDGDRAHVSIVSESDILVGKNGQVLDALQELTRLAVLADTGQRSRLMLDVAGFRAKRRVELVALASDAAQEAKDTSEPVHLTAMNPFERKIVHDAVAAAGLTSESEGEEPRRHVVVLPVGD